MARFQQKQMQEKEQKLLQLYDKQQQRAYQVIHRGSAGSTGSVSQLHSVMRTTTTTHSTSNPQGGKVRQMFDERRHTTMKGIDRSYPLEPLDNIPVRPIAACSGPVSSKQNQTRQVVRQTVTVRRAVRPDVNSNLDSNQQIISYPEELSQGSFNDENLNGVHIEEIIDDETIERNRMLAKIHLMEYDENLRHRIDNDLNSEKFPDDLMVDIPDKLPRKRMTKKLSDAEARLERFKNAMIKRSSAVVTQPVSLSESRKRSDPTRVTAKNIISSGSTVHARSTDVGKVRRSALERSPSPVPVRSTNKTTSRPSTPSTRVRRSGKSIELSAPTKTVEQVKINKSIDRVQSSTTSPVPAQNSPSPDLADRKNLNPTVKSLPGRSFPASPTVSADISSRDISAASESRNQMAVKRTSQVATKNHGISGTPSSKTVPSEPCRVSPVGALCPSKHQPRTDNAKSPTPAPTTTRDDVVSSLSDIDNHSKEKFPATMASSTLTEVHSDRPSTPQNRRRPSPATRSPSPRTSSALSLASGTSTSARNKVSGDRSMAGEQKTTMRSPAMTASTRITSSRNGPSTVNSDTLVACKSCGRSFAQDRISLHEKICTKTGQKKRKQFDTVLHRVQGTELEAFAKKGVPGKQAERRVKKPEVKAKSNWRRKHEDFINAIRSAKQVQAHLAAGGKLSDLPPPPASDTSDYIQCPHCGRKFNQGAAERHIPKCATMMHNKPKPRAPPKPRR